jgi:voltage-gated potassium channel Kch
VSPGGQHHVESSKVDPRQMTGHVIVCGLAGVGFRTVEQLPLADVPVVVVDDDPDPRLARVAQGWGVPPRPRRRPPR